LEIAMPSCPQCNRPLIELTRQCPSCRADLDLLVEYVNGLQGTLYRADQLTRAGELGSAVWAYLEVLEVDPDNPLARRQVGQVATAVRQFDRTAPGRRWAAGLPLTPEEEYKRWAKWVKRGLVVCALLVAFAIGYLTAYGLTSDSSAQGDHPESTNPPLQRNQNDQLGRPG
jgi:hypothetical protein